MMLRSSRKFKAMFTRPPRTILFALCLLGLTATAQAVAPDAEVLIREYQNMQRTVATLRDAYQRKAGADVKAATLAEADARVREAQDLAAARQYDMALTILEEGKATLAKAISQQNNARPANTAGLSSGSAALDTHRQADANKDKVTRIDFDRKKSELQTLLDAGRRIAKEKNKPADFLEAPEKFASEAEGFARKEQWGPGVQRLQLAYLLARNAIRGQRQGEELRADKNFATPADEYRYEQGRNDEYQTLVGLLPNPSPSWPALITSARDARNTADQHAGGGSYPQAIQTIETSTLTYKRIIREAGFPL